MLCSNPLRMGISAHVKFQCFAMVHFNPCLRENDEKSTYYLELILPFKLDTSMKV